MFIEYFNKYGDLDRHNLAYLAVNLDKKTRNNVMLALKVNRKLSNNMALSAIHKKYFKEHNFFEFMKDLRPLYDSEVSYYFEGQEYKKNYFNKLIKDYELKINPIIIDELAINNKSMAFIKALKKAKELLKAPKKTLINPNNCDQLVLEQFLKAYNY